MIKTDLSGFVVTLHKGLLKQYIQYISQHPLKRVLTVSHTPCSTHCNRNPSRNSVDPFTQLQSWLAHRMTCRFHSTHGSIDDSYDYDEIDMSNNDGLSIFETAKIIC